MRIPFMQTPSGFDLLQQQAINSELIAQKQAEKIAGTPQEILQGQRYSAALRPDMPQLKTEVNAKGIWDGVGQGVGNALNNYVMMKDYRARQQQAQQYESQYQAALQAQAERNQALATYLEANGVGPLAGLLPAEQNVTLGAQMGQNSIANQNTPAAAVAKEKGEQQVRTMRDQEFTGTGLAVEKDGIPQPQGVNEYRQIYGFAPTTTQDVNKAELGNVSQDIANQQATLELGATPQKIQDDQAKAKLEIQRSQLDNQIKAVEAKFVEDEKRLKVQGDNIANEKTRQEMQMFSEGRRLFKNLQESGDLYTDDPNKQAEIQAQLGIYGVKWNPPESNYTTIKKKDGSVWMLDKTNGQVGKLEKDGTVKQWQDLQ